MSLKIFEFVDEVINCLEEYQNELEQVAEYMKLYFEDIASNYGEGYLNINCRVKSSNSLKEKILRNNYYKIYPSPKKVLQNLHDLIGIRVECRFINDEKNIYDLLRDYFYKTKGDGLYYNSNNNSVLLDFKEAQPQLQKNGFEIYRIDGFFVDEKRKFRFELQIKSLVNVFWGEIEHKIIYKNYNYILSDKFLKEIMGSLKKNLTMIDNQMLLIYEQFNRSEAKDLEVRKNQVEGVLTKGIYDIFASNMKDNIGFIVDFKKSCETIIKYIFRSNKATNIEEYNLILINALTRLNELSHYQINFLDELDFERDLEFNDEFSQIVANNLLEVINYDFQWNLFFKMLFHICPGNNAEDFESFISFFKDSFYNFEELKMLQDSLGYTNGSKVGETILLEIAKIFEELQCIEFIYNNNIEKIKECIHNFTLILLKNISTIDEWEKSKSIFIKFFKINILLIFNDDLDSDIIEELMQDVKYCSLKIEIPNEYLRHLESLDEFLKSNDEKSNQLLKLLSNNK